MTAVQDLVETMREKILFRQNVLFVEVLNILIKILKYKKDKDKAPADGDLYIKQTEHPLRKLLNAIL